jgi:hypothetical protein
VFNADARGKYHLVRASEEYGKAKRDAMRKGKYEEARRYSDKEEEILETLLYNEYPVITQKTTLLPTSYTNSPDLEKFMDTVFEGMMARFASHQIPFNTRGNIESNFDPIP